MTWKKGQSGNPKGVQRGTKHKLNERFLKCLANDFKEHGITAIGEMRTKDPSGYVKTIAALVPKEMLLDVEVRNTVINAQPELTTEEWMNQTKPLSGDLSPDRKLN